MRIIKQALVAVLAIAPIAAAAQAPAVERVTTKVPFPRGLAMVDGELVVLARGRVRDAGGVTAEVDDRAGTIYRVNANISEPLGTPPSVAVQNNGEIVAEPTEPPFLLWDRSADPPQADTRTDRPYCTLRYHEPTKSLYLCAFSGIDMKKQPGSPSFSKNPTDAMLRYDFRTGKWYEVERHSTGTWDYPHHNPASNPPPHGLLKGPDNCLPLGRWLYAVAKDNSVLARYDLSTLEANPEAGAPQGEIVMGETVTVEGLGEQTFRGQSGLAFHDGWLYISYRTTSEVIRIRLDENHSPVKPIVAQLIARFDPWNPETGYSPDLTDIAVDEEGMLYVLSAKPAKVYRFRPDPDQVYDARDGARAPWIHLADATNNQRMKSENIMPHDGWLYVTSGDGYDYQEGAWGTVYRVRIADGAARN